MAGDVTIAVLPARSAEVASNEGNRLERISLPFGSDRYTVNFGSSSILRCNWTIPVLPELYDFGTGAKFLRVHAFTDGTTGDLDWTVRAESITAGDAINLSSTYSFSDWGTLTNSTFPGIADRLYSFDVPLTSTVNEAVGDYLRVQLVRNGVADTATATVKVLGCELIRNSTTFDLTSFDQILVPNREQVCQGRLTLASGDPVPSTDQTAKTTIYFTPYKGNVISLYDGTVWRDYDFTEVSKSLGVLSNNIPYDMFIYLSGTSLVMQNVAWTNATTRATNLALQDGVYVMSGTATKRYLGTFYTTSTTTTEDSESKRYVWNYYNRVPRQLYKSEGATSHTYGTASWREWNNGTGGPHRVYFITGVAQAFSAGGNGEIKGDDTNIAYVSLALNSSTIEGIATTMNQNLYYVRGAMYGDYISRAGFNELVVTQYGSGGSPTFNAYKVSASVMG